MTDVQKAIHALECNYAEQKEVFDKWKEENASEADTEPYLEYVEQFQSWEKGVLDQLKELRASIVRQPVAPEPEQPLVDLDTQLNTLLERIDMPQFIMAFMTMSQKDPIFLKKAFEVIMDECRNTGFANPIIPQQAAMHPSSSSSTASMFGARYTHQRPSSASGIAQQAAGSPAGALYLPPTAHQPQPYVPGSSLLAGSSSHYAANTPPTAYTQITPYAVIPEGWAVDAPIRKQPKPSSPIREYRTPMNLPFKDFSQS